MEKSPLTCQRCKYLVKCMLKSCEDCPMYLDKAGYCKCVEIRNRQECPYFESVEEEVDE